MDCAARRLFAHNIKVVALLDLRVASLCRAMLIFSASFQF